MRLIPLYDSLVQLAEHYTFNVGILSSSLRWVTIWIGLPYKTRVVGCDVETTFSSPDRIKVGLLCV